MKKKKEIPKGTKPKEEFEDRMDDFNKKFFKMVNDYYKNNIKETKEETNVGQLDYELILMMSSNIGWIVQSYYKQDVQAMMSDLSDWIWAEKKRLNDKDNEKT